MFVNDYTQGCRKAEIIPVEPDFDNASEGSK